MCGTAARSGILLGSDPNHVKVARRWAAQATRSQPSLAQPISVVVSELVTNALAHTASGQPGGTVRLEIERTRLYLEVLVTDNGPHPGQAMFTFPSLPPRSLRTQAPGNGLRLVEALSVYWEWDGSAGGPLTVRALFAKS